MPVDRTLDDDATAHGPASATTTAATEGTSEEASKWLSIIEEGCEEAAELGKIPAMQETLEKAERRAALVIANEVESHAGEGGCEALDEAGREELIKLCRQFRGLCQSINV